jgi:Acetyltransferase (GNAT) domain
LEFLFKPHSIAPTITYCKHSDIDKIRWDALIQQFAQNRLIYAHTDMLDAMSPGWDALVLGDYEAVMPLTWRKKLGIRYLCQPAFCQQLGIFSAGPIDAETIGAFLRKASVSFRLIEIYLNYANPVQGGQTGATNFVLPLGKDYQSLQANYRRDLMKNLARTGKFSLQYVVSDDIDNAIAQYRLLYGNRMNMRPQDYDALSLLCKKWQPAGKCFVREVHLHSGDRSELLATGLFLKDNNRIYNIASTTLPNGRTLEANHFLFDQLIREFAGQNLLLDFEGSDLPGVARFYQKFGPENQPYFFWKSNRLPAVLRWWKR